MLESNGGPEGRKGTTLAYKIIENCIGSGCELCINVCPFDALSLQDSPHNKDFYGMATVDPRKCTGCRLCEQSCGWAAIYIDPPREMLKRKGGPRGIPPPPKSK